MTSILKKFPNKKPNKPAIGDTWFNHTTGKLELYSSGKITKVSDLPIFDASFFKNVKKAIINNHSFFVFEFGWWGSPVSGLHAGRIKLTDFECMSVEHYLKQNLDIEVTWSQRFINSYCFQIGDQTQRILFELTYPLNKPTELIYNSTIKEIADFLLRQENKNHHEYEYELL